MGSRGIQCCSRLGAVSLSITGITLPFLERILRPSTSEIHGDSLRVNLQEIGLPWEALDNTLASCGHLVS